MPIRVKICGITTAEAARVACDAGADALGFVFAESPRRLDLARAREIAAVVPPAVRRVAVFRNPAPAELAGILAGFPADLVQVEPDERLSAALGELPLLPVFHDGEKVEDEIERFVAGRGEAVEIHLEAAGRGGRGVAPSWERAALLARGVRLTLAGGLSPDNVARAIREVRPFGVDVSSGVESAPGIKDARLVRRFVEEARGCRLDGTMAAR